MKESKIAQQDYNTCCCYKHKFLSFCRIDTTFGDEEKGLLNSYAATEVDTILNGG